MTEHRILFTTSIKYQPMHIKHKIKAHNSVSKCVSGQTWANRKCDLAMEICGH